MIVVACFTETSQTVVHFAGNGEGWQSLDEREDARRLCDYWVRSLAGWTHAQHNIATIRQQCSRTWAT